MRRRTVTKASATGTVGITIAFNSTVQAADIVEGTDFTVTDANNANVTGFTVAGTGCDAVSTSCSISIKKDLAPGAYTFTMKSGAAASDLLGNVYTQPVDRVIHFTVAPPPVTPPATPCL